MADLSQSEHSRRWTIGRSGNELYVSEGTDVGHDEYVEVMPVAEYETLRGAALAVVEADQGFRHPALGLAISYLREALEHVPPVPPLARETETTPRGHIGEQLLREVRARQEAAA